MSFPGEFCINPSRVLNALRRAPWTLIEILLRRAPRKILVITIARLLMIVYAVTAKIISSRDIAGFLTLKFELKPSWSRVSLPPRRGDASCYLASFLLDNNYEMFRIDTEHRLGTWPKVSKEPSNSTEQRRNRTHRRGGFSLLCCIQDTAFLRTPLRQSPKRSLIKRPFEWRNRARTTVSSPPEKILAVTLYLALYSILYLGNLYEGLSLLWIPVYISTIL